MSDINDRIKELRLCLKLSQEAFAGRLSIRGPSISRIEKKDRPVTARLIKAIVSEFGASRDWLETGDGEMFDSSDARITVALEDILLGEDDVGKALLKTIATFSDEEWALLKRMIERFVKEYGVQSDD